MSFTIITIPMCCKSNISCNITPSSCYKLQTKHDASNKHCGVVRFSFLETYKWVEKCGRDNNKSCFLRLLQCSYNRTEDVDLTPCRLTEHDYRNLIWQTNWSLTLISRLPAGLLKVRRVGVAVQRQLCVGCVSTGKIWSEVPHPAIHRLPANKELLHLN